MLLSQSLGKLTRHPAYWMLPSNIQEEYQSTAFHPEWTFSDLSPEAQTCATWIVSLLERNGSPVKMGPGWDESKHPRIPKGVPGAGQFAPKYIGYVRGRKIDPSELAVWRKFRRENPDPEQWPKRREYNKYGRDEIALEMLHRQGFDNLPLVLPPNEFDRWVAENNALVLYRGVEDGKYFTGEFDANGNPVVGKQTAREITDQFRYGQFYWGNGTFGNGTYASADRGVAEAYGNLDPDSQIGDIPGDLLVMAVRPEAIIVDHQKLKYEFAHSTFVPPSMPKELYDSALVLFNKGRPDDARGVISTWVREHPYREHEYMFGDLGRYALLQGHDAQRITTELGYTEYVIFNRTALVVRGAE